MPPLLTKAENTVRLFGERKSTNRNILVSGASSASNILLLRLIRHRTPEEARPRCEVVVYLQTVNLSLAADKCVFSSTAMHSQVYSPGC